MSAPHFDSKHYKEGQRQQWNSVATGWQTWWPTFENIAQTVSDRLIQLADIQPGHHVLDIATGIGEPAITAARQVGNGGRVVALDQSSEMLDIARERATQLDLKNVEFLESDAEQTVYPNGYFDAVVCRWGLMYLPNLVTTLANVRQMLMPNGKLAAAIWDVPERTPFISLAFSTAREMFELPQPLPGTPYPSGLADGVIEDAMEQAGFSSIRTENVTVEFAFPSAAYYVRYMQDVAAPVNALLAEKTYKRQQEYWRALEVSAQAYPAPDGGVLLPSVSPCIIARP